MIQKFAFTTAAMTTALEDTNVTYEELAEIEKSFEDIETEIGMLPPSMFQYLHTGCSFQSRSLHCYLRDRTSIRP
jgi:hypothetical protein